MDKKTKKLILIGAVQAAILIFALVVSIIVWTTVHNEQEAIVAGMKLPDYNYKMNGAFIAFFQNHTTAFFLIIVLPIFLFIAADFVYLILTAYKKESKLSEDQLKAIKAKAEAEAREEVMKELLEQENKPEEKAEEK